jgi:hypothetical protein
MEKPQRRMINLHIKAAKQLAQLKLNFAIVLGREITNRELIQILNHNAAIIIAALQLAGKIKRSENDK